MTGRKSPVKAAVAPALQEKLTSRGLDPETLKTDFIEWKEGGDDDSYVFAKDGLNRGSKYLSHAHMVPSIEAAKAVWDSAWTKYRKRTSDRFLFYVDGGLAYGFLLLDIADDPGAHKVWENEPSRVKKLEHAAEAFYMSGVIPALKS